jgi:hypothetical protein
MLFAATAWMVSPRLTGAIGDGSPNGRERAWFTPRGFHRPEVDDRPSRHFSWSMEHAELRVPHIDRSRRYRVSLRMAAGRGPSTPPPPHFILSVDGVPALRGESSNEPRVFSVDTPVAGRSTLVVGIDLSNTFVPGPQDRRALGVVVDQVTIEPVDDGWRPTWRVALLAALATTVAAAVVAASGFAPPWTAVVGVLVGGAHVWLLALDGAFLGRYVERLLHIALGTGAIGASVALARHRWPAAGVRGWDVAVGLTVVAAGLKIAFFGHPNVALADSIFQVHRAQNVAAGQYFFTSITPRPYFEFPYAIALYVAAMPLWDWFPTELDRVRLLRGVSIAADALAGVAMYLALGRAWPGHRTAIAFVALWPFARSPLGALCTSNLTNLFGQGLFGTAMGLVAWMAAAGRANTAGLAGVAVLLTAAFLSHVSTVSVGIPLAGLTGVILALGGQGATRRLGIWLVAIVLAAAAVSYVVYYAHFHEVYRATLERVADRDGADDERSMAAPVVVKADRWQRLVRAEFGWPALVCAIAGAVWLARERRRPVAMVLAGWGLAWLIFSALGVVTPIEMRANLAAAPFVLALASYGLGTLAHQSRAGVVLASAAGMAIACDGFTRWLHCLTG